MTRIVILASLLAVACGAAPKKGETLMESVMVYHEGIRWDRLANAATRVPPAERDDFVDERDELGETLRITEWEVVRVRPRQGGEAAVHVKYTWYLDGEGVVRETHAEQRWASRDKVWFILDERRLRGDEMPGLAEPEPGTAEDPEDPDASADEASDAAGARDAGAQAEGPEPPRARQAR